MESKKRAFFFTLLFAMVCMVMQAQSLQVEGTVISKSDGEPIIGATVLEKGTTNGTITDFGGRTLHGNFYKCGDLLQVPHFLSWNPIQLPKPCFHCPEFFGELIFKK